MFAKNVMVLAFALLLAVILPQAVAAQNGNGNGGGGGPPWCWWCFEVLPGYCGVPGWVWNEEEQIWECPNWVALGLYHFFHPDGKGCPGGETLLAINGNGNGNGGAPGCVPCGGQSLCHVAYPDDVSEWEDWEEGPPPGVMEGPCHPAAWCAEWGGGQQVAMALLDLEDSLQTGTAEDLARIVRTSPSVQVLAAGSIRVLPPCGSSEEPTALTIPLDLAEEVIRLLAD